MRLTHLRIRYGRGAPGMRAVVLGASWSGASWSSLPAAVATPVWRPPCDVLEGGDGWTIRAEIAGLRDEDLQVALYEDSLVAEGAREWPGAVEGERVLLTELRYGLFRLELPISDEIDRDAARASYERGLLTVVLPRRRRSAAP